MGYFRYMPEGSFRFRLGSLWCTVLSDGYYAYPLSWFFPNAEFSALASELARKRLPQDQILSPYACLLIETRGRVALVDTGAGTCSSTTGAIEARLEMAGIRPRDVDTVVLTHAHPDHIGGVLDARGRPHFINAAHYISEREHEFWMAPRRDLRGMQLPEETKRSTEEMARRCLTPLRHHIEPVDREMEVFPGVRVLPAPGHTPGHMALLLGSEGQQVLVLGDAAVHPLHLEHPEWENGFDLAPDRAAATRRILLDRAAADGMHVMAFHFPFPSVGRVEKRNGGWEWIPGF
jgi:glyoxylase-like metal-dependent hydrolase (beta-lactamase superfamily II)